MAIYLTDTILSQLAKPVDAKTVVGPVNPSASQFFEYQSKEDIPEFERYTGMTVLDVTTYPYVTWRLEQGTSDGHWEEITTEGATKYSHFSLTAQQDNALFDIPDEFTQNNTIVNINGVTLQTSDYIIQFDTTSNINRILLSFDIETGDELNLTRLS